jgi:Kef-type K+ transport system membrane component KefB
LVIGVILGPTLLNMLHWGVFHEVDLAGTIKELAELGVLLLMFIVGLEINVNELVKAGRVGLVAGVLGTLVPVALAMPLVLLFDYTWEPALFAGVTLAATSVSISAQVLLELGHLRTKEGNALLATALIDDILAILLVSIAIAVVGTRGESANAGELIGIVLRMAGFIVGAFLVSWFVLPRALDWLSHLPSATQSYGVPALALVAALVFGWAAEEIGGIATITGSFIAGLGMSRTRDHVHDEIEESMGYLAYAFLVPVFFIDVGLQTDLSSFPLSELPFATLLLAVAILSKIGGCGLGARAAGFTNRESLRVGVCMISRGEVGLIIASLGLSAGVFTADGPLFASLFLVILLTTVVTPILVRMVFPKPEDEDSRPQKQVATGANPS